MKGFKNVMLILLMVGVFSIHLKSNAIIKAKCLTVKNGWVEAYTLESKNCNTFEGELIYVPKEHVKYIMESKGL